MAHDYHDEYVKSQQEVARLKAALSDVASSEPIPTPAKGWEFCRDVALAALAEGGAK